MSDPAVRSIHDKTRPIPGDGIETALTIPIKLKLAPRDIQPFSKGSRFEAKTKLF